MRTLYYYCAPEVTATRRAEFAQLIAAAQDAVQAAASAQEAAPLAGAWQLVAVSDYDALIKATTLRAKATTLRAKGKTVTGLALEPEDVLLELTPPMAGVGLRLGSLANFKPLVIDFEQVAVRQRLLRGGRQKEAVARAVMAGLPDGALVFDATAGLGRESMILAHAGANVLSFERQLPIWCILHDGLLRAGRSRFYPFPVPTLHPLGTIKDYRGTERPEVIYYDPMFPERAGSAQVKKDMHIFQEVIGADTDNEDFLRAALSLATRRVVVKRPDYAPPLSYPGIELSYSVDGGQCRFDCYQADSFQE